jgi:hypothetical protein
MFDEQIARYEELARERSKLQEQAEDKTTAQAIVERNRTEAERAKKDIETARDLFTKGALSRDDYLRELARIKDDIVANQDDADARKDQGPSSQRPTLMEATATNIARAFDSLRQVDRGEGGAKTVEERQLKVAQEEKAVLLRIERHLQETAGPPDTLTI